MGGLRVTARGALWAGVLAAGTSAGSAEPRPVPVDFDREIRPILADNCFTCHGPDEAARQAGLRLDRREAAVAPAESGLVAIVPGDADNSELVARISESDESLRMPPPESNLSLTSAERQRLVDWIRQGAEYQTHWSLAAARRPSLPHLAAANWPRNPIDAFILARLEVEQLPPSPAASAYRLVRRLYLDLLGLPPTPEEADAFLSDSSPDAYERLVDQLLADPAFGERMSWEWLDAARYADSNGYQGDRERTMWPWRDWVIKVLNENLAFDTFTLWQLAGDLLPHPTDEQILATGFCRNHMINGEGGRIPDENRVDYVMDMTETTGTVWLGLTFNCCRCHDHKFDPLLRRDYYGLFAFFNQTPVTGAGGDPQTPPVLAVASAPQQAQLAHLSQLLSQQQELIERQELSLKARSLDSTGSSEKQVPDAAALHVLLGQPVESRTHKQWKQLAELAASLADDYSKSVSELVRLMDRRQKIEAEIPKVMVMQDQDQRRPTYLLKVGLYNQPEDEVTAAFPEVFHVAPAPQANRLDLARWLVDPENPLTSRVVVNRLWQHFFGRGIVKTAEDFGTQGERPTHAELLDWLAVEFRESGWDVKHLCRLIVTSRTYQQSSVFSTQSWERDPENRLWARGPRYRLPSWVIRDQALAASGLLVRELGGPPVHPYQPPGVWEEATFGNKKYPLGAGAELYRRSLYTFWRRIVSPTGFFDTASRQSCRVTPSRTNSPLHALTIWNDTTYVEAGRVLAQRLIGELPHAEDEQRVRTAFRRILIRPPTPAETETLLASLARMRLEFRQRPEQAQQFIQVGEDVAPAELDIVELAALGGVCNLLFNLDEAVTKE